LNSYRVAASQWPLIAAADGSSTGTRVPSSGAAFISQQVHQASQLLDGAVILALADSLPDRPRKQFSNLFPT
jgi:hypothetical protein